MKTKKTTKRKGSTARKSKGLDFSVKNLKRNSINGLATLGGVSLAHGIKTYVPVKNEKVKVAIPIALGAVGLASGNKNTSSTGAGMFAYGSIALLRNLLGLDGSPISGISDNETVQKIANALLPSLGDTNPYALVYGANEGYPRFEPVEDVDHVELNGAFDENPFLEGGFDSEVNPFANEAMGNY